MLITLSLDFVSAKLEQLAHLDQRAMF